jgi:acetamidase/formamidase
MGVALNTTAPVNSVPPNAGAGNLDIQDFTVGSRLWVPVMVPGASFYTGDPHFAMGDGEVALTAIEGSAACDGAPHRAREGRSGDPRRTGHAGRAVR